MLTVNEHKKFTANADIEAEKLLEKVLSEIKETLSGTGLSVFLGGSYGRGDGGVRIDRENGILYNDLDFFVFARRKTADAESLLKKIAEKYEHELKVDVDFSRIMTVKDIKNNASRLMMQELKRGYHHVCGEDLIEKYLIELPADKLPFSEACRLLLNRGMGLLLAGEKISENSDDTDFILRNIYKAVLGTVDAMLITDGNYRWKISERLEFIEKSDMPESQKILYREAVDFKRSPHRQRKQDMISFLHEVRTLLKTAILHCAGEYENLRDGIFNKCCQNGEISVKNYIKYCIKSRTLPLTDWKYYTIPTAALLLQDIYESSNNIPDRIDKQSKLYRHWLIFN